ncbi:transposase [Fictibacillus enclensis]
MHLLQKFPTLKQLVAFAGLDPSVFESGFLFSLQKIVQISY